MRAQQALAFVERHGIVLVSARGPIPNLVEFLVGGKVRGSWWSHPRARQLYAILQVVTASPDVVLCGLVDGKQTLLHRRLWAPLVRLAKKLPQERLAARTDRHTASGAHRVTSLPFPTWVPPEVLEAAALLTEEEATAALGEAPLDLLGPPRKGARRKAATLPGRHRGGR